MALSLLNAAFFSAVALAAQPEQEMVLHFQGHQGARLYEFLSQRGAQPTHDEGLVYYGNTLSIGCSALAECFVVVYEKEWGMSWDDQHFNFDFVLPFGPTILTGHATTGNSQLDLQLTDAKTGATFRFENPIACLTESCRYGFAPRNWTLERRESHFVLEHSRQMTLAIKGHVAQTLYEMAPSETQTEQPMGTRVQPGSDLYCWKLSFEAEPYRCQATLRPEYVGSLPYFTTRVSAGQTLMMYPYLSYGMLDSYGLFVIQEGGLAASASCDPKPTRTAADCRYYYDEDIDASEYPIPEDLPGGIAVGWGRQPMKPDAP